LLILLYFPPIAEEWEKLYQPVPLVQQIEETKRAVEQRRLDRIAREKIITECMEKMDSQMKQWRARVSSKNVQAESERMRREQVSYPGLWIRICMDMCI
jgi:hypothetical protein